MKYLVDQQWAREIEAESPVAAMQKALELRRGDDSEKYPELFHVYSAGVVNRREWTAFEVEQDGKIKNVG
jgi:hypothetical protein